MANFQGIGIGLALIVGGLAGGVAIKPLYIAAIAGFIVLACSLLG